MFQKYARPYIALVTITTIIAVLMIGTGLYNYYFANHPIVIESQEHNASVRFSADRSMVLSYDDCIRYDWDLDRITSVYFDGAGMPGLGNATICARYPTEHSILVTFQDGAEVEYVIDIQSAIPWNLFFYSLVPLLVITGWFWGTNLANGFPLPTHIPNPIGKTGLRFVPQLDGLRAVALLLVFVAHFMWPQVQWGRLGVILFFVLSGFLIGTILFVNRKRAEVESEPKSSIVKNFYARRFLRIFPVYYLTLFIMFVVGYPPVMQNIWWFLTYTFNIGAGFFGLRLEAANHFWSLAVEEQFYIFFPLVALFMNRKYLKNFLYFLVFVSLAYKYFGWYFGINWLGLGWSLIGSFDSLCLGALYALFLSNPKEHERDAKAVLTISGIVGPALLVITQVWRVLWMEIDYGSVPLFMGFSDLGIVLCSILTIHSVLLYPNSLAIRFLNLNWMRYIGKISYSAYVYHYFIPLTDLVPGRTFVSFIVYSIISLALASLSWYVFEKPINHFKDRFPYLKEQKSPQVATVKG